MHDASQSAMEPEDDIFDLTKEVLGETEASQPAEPELAPSAEPDANQPSHLEERKEDVLGAVEDVPVASSARERPRGHVVACHETSAKGDEAVERSVPSQDGDTKAPTQGWLVENISRKMTVDRAEELEIRIAPELSARLLEGLSGSGKPVKHHVPVTTVMCLPLAAPKGGFSIFSHSPDAQLVRPEQDRQDNDNGIAAWHFTVIPTRRGTNLLRLTLSYRKISADGLVADSTLPDRTIEVQVRTNLGKLTIRTGAWTLTLVAGAALGAYFDKIDTVLSTLIR